MQVTKPGFR